MSSFIEQRSSEMVSLSIVGDDNEEESDGLAEVPSVPLTLTSFESAFFHDESAFTEISWCFGECECEYE